MTARDIIAPQLDIIGQSKVTISTATTASFDFGTPNDINLATITADAPGLLYAHGDRVLLVLTASTAGTTDSLTWVVQDADDSSGSIGTPATAVTSGTLAVGTGDAFSVISVKVQSGRPWIRVRVTSSGATDTFVTHCVALAVPAVL